MARRILLVFAAFAVVCACVFGAGLLAEPDAGVHSLEEGSVCPVAGCAGECHGYSDVPVPDGSFEMICPEAGCASTECHAWDTLSGRYHQASDASLNIWILAPVALTIGLLALVRLLSRPEKQGDANEPPEDDLAEGGGGR